MKLYHRQYIRNRRENSQPSACCRIFALRCSLINSFQIWMTVSLLNDSGSKYFKFKKSIIVDFNSSRIMDLQKRVNSPEFETL